VVGWKGMPNTGRQRKETTPLDDPLRFRRRAEPCVLVLFGANGDLARRKLIPALFRMKCDRLLPPGFVVIGNSRTALTNDAFREKMQAAVQEFTVGDRLDPDHWHDFAQRLYYVPGDLRDRAMYRALQAAIQETAAARETPDNVLFYLATAPGLYGTVIERLGESGLTAGQGWRRIIIEKPFGRDTASARALSEQVRRVFPERDVYRIDHFLGKETVQNVLAFRFGNGIFEPLWNRRYVDHVQITAAESIGVEGRGSYYQEAGALRDMIQNHLLQVMATVAMEPPAAFEAEAVRDERAKLLRSVRLWRPEEVPQYAVAGQYGPARIGGEDVPGFRQEPGVDPESQTETYAAVTFYVDNWRWAGVPFYLRTGKRLARRVTDVAIQFRPAPHALFEGTESSAGRWMQPNLLVLRIQPDEGISLRFSAKRPGSGMRLRSVSMDFNYGVGLGARAPAAYETLLLDAMAGDATLYIREDMVEASWRAVQPILDVWAESKFDFPNYPAGSWGPPEADAMLARNGHRWRTP